MIHSLDRLYELMPVIYRLRDAEKGYPLRELLRVIAEQVDIIEADTAQLYDNLFIETCQDWVVPYIGDLISYQTVHSTGQLGNVSTSEKKQHNKILIPRREVANTLSYRRRKGTLVLLELLADRVAGWPARVVEFYHLLDKIENLNHLHLSGRSTVDLRLAESLEQLGSPFDALAHTVEVRSISSPYERGLHNIPSIGVFVWRLKAYSVTRTPAYCLEEVSSNCYTFSITGNDIPLYTRPTPEADPAGIAGELNLPIPIKRRLLNSHLSDYYHPNKSLQIWEGSVSGLPRLVSADRILIADLSDWSYQPPLDCIAVDPELGRMVFPQRQLPKNGVWVSYHYGFSADIGGGEYARPILNPPDHPECLLLDADDLQDATSFIAKLQNGSALSDYLRSQFSEDTKRLLLTPSEYPEAPLDAVIEELNRLLLGESLYEEQRFASIALTEKIKNLAEQNLQGKELIRLNRLLLEAAYPNEIRQHYMLYQVERNSGEYSSITDALLQWKRDNPLHAVIEITDSGVYEERIAKIALGENQSLQLRAANHKRPVIRILDWRTSFGDALNITVKSGSCFILDGLLITGRGVHIEGDTTQSKYHPITVFKNPAKVVVRHSTLVPGWSLHCDCEPRRSTEASLDLLNTDARITVEHSIIGSIQINQDEVQTDPLPINISDSIVDATSVEGEAIGAVGCSLAHARLTIARCTVFGQIQVHAIDLAENSIFNGKIFVARRQQGCIRFCYVTPDSRTPSRYHCQPDLVEQAVTREDERLVVRHRVQPQFNSTRYGTPTYCQLANTCAEEIKSGADDESEMGVFHHLYQPQRETNLRIRLNEYTPAGMEAGIIYAS